ncbi:MAG: transketolase [Coxiella sp. (in: Bacteria)]|nr:MAG: transketolase [Coxiella sp. (in: g-proteobacteria)]
MRNKFADVFNDEAKQNSKLVMVVADISPAGSMMEFRDNYPERFINVGVSEQIMIGIAAGLALRGLRPFTYTIATFALYRPFEFVRDDLCYQNLPVTVVGMGAGVVYSTLGATHHTMEDISIATSIPNMTVVAPCDPLEAEAVTKWCARDSQGPVYLRLGKAGEPNFTQDAVDTYVFGKMRYICRGEDVCILTYGPVGIKLAFELKDDRMKDVSLSIVSCHTLKPFDTDGLKEIFQSHSRVIVIEEHVPRGGLSSRVKEFAWDNKVDCELQCHTLKDEFIHFYGTHEDLLKEHGLAAEFIA